MASTLDTTGGIELPSSIYNTLNMTVGPLWGQLSGFLLDLANFTAGVPFGNYTLDIVRWLTSFLIPLAPSAPGASSMYQTSPSYSAADIPPWWANFASYVAMWGWPLLLKRIPGHGYRILADTEGHKGVEYDPPAYMQGLRPPVVGG